MPSKNQFPLYADECFPLTSVIYLRSLGYSAIHASDKKSIGENDNFHLKLAKKEKRILITLDRDFIYYEQVSLASHPGVIVVEAGSAVPEHINKICKKALKYLTEEQVAGSLVKISSARMIKIKEGKIVYEKEY